jgi:hypothetical protein
LRDKPSFDTELRVLIRRMSVENPLWGAPRIHGEPITLEVHLPGDDDDKPTARIDAPIEDLAAQLPAAPADVDDPFLEVAIGFQFNPLAIAQEGRITVSAIKSGKRYRIGSLRVISEPPPETKEAAN